MKKKHYQVDGDTDSSEVQEEFTRVLMEEMEKAEAIAAMPQNDQAPLPQNGNVSGMSNVIIREACKSTIF